MKKTTAISGVAITAVALSLVLVGCGSKSDSTQESAATKTSEATAAPGTENTAGPNPTIATYVQENHIQETPIHRGDPGAPNINLPVPEGWADAGGDIPEWAYSAIVYTGPEAAQYTPRIVAKMFKLTGNVDPKKILELAPGELRNLNGWIAASEGSTTTLAGHDAYQLGGAWVDSQTKIVAQKTVVIPRSDGLYVLQLNADGLPDQIEIVSTATDVIDAQTTIT
jgi:Probable lipoprotein LpqN